MQTLLTIPSTTLALVLAAASAGAGETRHYWIAAEEVDWDYAGSYPSNPMTGQPFTEDQRVFVERFIGRTYRKSVYREYTADFERPKARGAEDEHLGLLGPTLRAEVGDTLIVEFRNDTRLPASVHPHGVFYDKASEGAGYADGTDLKADDQVPPGGRHTYVWEVPERAGPGPRDPSSVAWLYHSHVNTPEDTNAGLAGTIIVTRQGEADGAGRPGDVDREFISLFMVVDENASPYLEANLERCEGTCDPGDEAFQESNLMHGINGLLWGNNTGYRMKVGERVRWHVIGLGTEVDLHTAHWHGVTLLHDGKRMDVAAVLPAAAKSLDLHADNPGTWMFHCHVNDHIDAGMMTLFTIE